MVRRETWRRVRKEGEKREKERELYRNGSVLVIIQSVSVVVSCARGNCRSRGIYCSSDGKGVQAKGVSRSRSKRRRRRRIVMVSEWGKGDLLQSTLFCLRHTFVVLDERMRASSRFPHYREKTKRRMNEQMRKHTLNPTIEETGEVERGEGAEGGERRKEIKRKREETLDSSFRSIWLYYCLLSL